MNDLFENILKLTITIGYDRIKAFQPCRHFICKKSFDIHLHCLLFVDMMTQSIIF